MFKLLSSNTEPFRSKSICSGRDWLACGRDMVGYIMLYWAISERGLSDCGKARKEFISRVFNEG